MGGTVKYVKENGVPYFIWRHRLKILLDFARATEENYETSQLWYPNPESRM